MRHDRWRDVVSLGVVVSLGLSLGGCCQYPGRCKETPSVRPGESHQNPSKRYPRGVRDPSRAGPTWRELPVLAVNLRREQAERHLIVKTRTPGAGWTVRVKALPATDKSEAEFQVVGLAPVTADLKLEERTIYREIRLSPGVEHVVVRGSEGSMLMDVE